MPNPIAFYDDNTSIQDVGRFVMAYQARQNAFVEALVNRIGMVLVTSKLWNNPLARYKKGYMDLGETIEEVFVNIARPFTYDPEEAEETWMKRVLPDVRAAFHTLNYQKFYKVTVQRNDLSKAFLSWQAVNSLVEKIVESMYTAANYDEFIVTKWMVVSNALNGFFHVEETVKPTSQDNLEEIIKAIRRQSRIMTFLKPDYNYSGVMNAAPVDDQYVWINASLDAEVDVEVLAKAFNMNMTDFIGHMEVLDSFRPDAAELDRLDELFKDNPDYVRFTEDQLAKLDDIQAIVFDQDLLMIFDNLNQADQIPNGQGLYWNYWYHQWKTFSLSPFANAYILFAGETAVTKVTVSPAQANVTQGSDMQFTAEVAGTGLYEEGIEWSVEPAGDYELASGTYINKDNGRLHVSADEDTEHQITVKASAGGKEGTATVTVLEG